MNSLIFGIDLGTTNSLIGVFEAGFPGLLAGPDGARLTPSALFFPPDKSAPLIGHPALRQRALAPGRTLTSIKRLMGRRFSEIDPAQFSFPVVADENGRAAVAMDGVLHTPEELSAHLLRHLRHIAGESLGPAGGPPERVVITVPAYFHDAQRAATRLAGELAGWTVERILSEPTAAALAYGFGRPGEKKRIAVFDLGGGTFDLSILEINDGVFEVLSTRGDTALGGDDIDRLIAAETARRLQWNSTPSSDPLAWGRLHEAAERAKIALSSVEETEILLPFLEDGKTESLLWNRPSLAEVARPVLDRIPPLCRQALHDARMEPSDLDGVLLVGGSTRMPAVRELAGRIFGREPDTTQHPDEAIALGACIQGGILGGHAPGLTLLDVTPLSLGLETYGGLMNVLIPRNTSIPCRAGEMFTNAVDHQQEMRLTVLQGEREMARDNWRLGEFCLPFTPAPRGRARVGVEFSIDADGILKVLARDTATGEEQIVRLNSAVQVEEARVEAMVEASVENAFADMNERIFTETKMKAEELLAALDAAFFQLGDALESTERVRLEGLAARARAAMESGDTRSLKTAVEALDEETEPLAALLLEKLMS